MHVQTIFHHQVGIRSVTTLVASIPNMSKDTPAYQKKVESAMRILQTTTGVKVLQAMILANFLKKDIAND